MEEKKNGKKVYETSILYLKSDTDFVFKDTRDVSFPALEVKFRERIQEFEELKKSNQNAKSIEELTAVTKKLS